MTAVPTSAATTTINTFKPNVRILEVPRQKGAIGQKRRFHENTPAAQRGGRSGALFEVRAAKVPPHAGHTHGGPVNVRRDPKRLDADVLTADAIRPTEAEKYDMGLISVLIGVLVIVVVGAICFWAIGKFANDLAFVGRAPAMRE